MHLYSIALNLLFAMVIFCLCFYRFLKDGNRHALIFSIVNALSILWVFSRLIYLEGGISERSFQVISVLVDGSEAALFLLSAYMIFREQLNKYTWWVFTIFVAVLPLYALFVVSEPSEYIVRFMPIAVLLSLSEVTLGYILIRYFDTNGKEKRIRYAVKFLSMGMFGLALMNPLYYLLTESSQIAIIGAISTGFKILLSIGLFLMFF